MSVTAVGAALMPITGRPMLVGSVIMLVIGIAYQVRFLKLCPKPTSGVANANA